MSPVVAGDLVTPSGASEDAGKLLQRILLLIRLNDSGLTPM